MRRGWVFVLMGAVSAWASACLAAPLSPPDERHAESIESKCRIVAQEQGGSHRALEAAIQLCVTQEAPSLAYWESCRKKARRQHLTGLKLRDDVTYCMSREP